MRSPEEHEARRRLVEAQAAYDAARRHGDPEALEHAVQDLHEAAQRLRSARHPRS